MNDFFKAIKGFFIYTEPNYTDFELLEENNEGTVDGNSHEVSGVKNDSGDEGDNNAGNTKPKVIKKAKGIKRPLNVDEWNEERDKPTESAMPQTSVSGGTMSEKLENNINYIKKKFNIPKNKDVIIRRFNAAKEISSCLVFIEGMADKNIINQFVLPQLMSSGNFDRLEGHYPIDYIERNVISINNVEKISNLDQAIQLILKGKTALFLEGCKECLIIESKGYEKRSVEKPATENVVRGSQEGFTEDLVTNITLLRRSIKNEKLITEILPIGKTTKVDCAVIYLEGVANAKVVKEVKRRINSLDIDYIQGDGMLEQLIEDDTYALFPQILSTERPDRASSFIVEGQVVVMAEGTPFILAVPVTLYKLLHSSEDYNLRWQFGTFLRFIRLTGLIISLFLPALYAGLTLYHQEMVPTELLVSITKSREKVPFPVVMELLIMEISFELIREGGIRVPGVIGQTLGIIGALILGQAAVAAGLVSPILIIVVAVTGLGSFTIPNYPLALGVRIFRFIFVVAAAIAGFYSLSAAIVIFLGLLCSMKSFGVPFLSPVAPKVKVNPDVVIRYPIWKQQMRPDYLNSPDKKRAGDAPRKWTKQNNGGRSK